MGKRLFVGNLPYTTTDRVLKEHFAAFGAVEDAYVVTAKETGESKGFGFVTMSTPAEAERAIAAVHQLGTRELTVNEARPKPETFRGGRPGGGKRDRESERR